MSPSRLPRWIPWTLLAFTALALLLLRDRALREKRMDDAGRPALAVEIASPAGEVKALRSIDVLFTETMVPLGARAKAKANVPLAIDPPIEGSFSWIGSRALTFVPRAEVPEGTKLTCRIPARTRSIEGHVLPNDHVWEITVGRPQLLASVPWKWNDRIAPDATIHLLFSLPPGKGAEHAVHLEGPSGPVALRRVVPDSADARAILWRARGKGSPDRILALRPKKALEPGASHTLRIEPAIPFAGSRLRLPDPISFLFSTFGPPGFLSVEASLWEIALSLKGPVDPDTLQQYLSIDPPIRDLRFETRTGTSFDLKGRIRPGETYRFRLRAGLPSLLGETLAEEDRAEATAPHASAHLKIFPSSGYLPRAENLKIRIEGTNVDSVEISGAWVGPRDLPTRLSRRWGEGRAVPLPRITTWLEPREHPDSALSLLFPLSKLGSPPRGSRAFQVRVRARPLFPDPWREVLTDEVFLQATDLGLSAVLGEESGLAWVTRLSDGMPVPGAEVRWLSPKDGETLWSGSTGKDGLAIGPGYRGLPLDPRAPIVAEARVADDAVRLLVPEHGVRWREPRGRPSEGRRTAHIETDRPIYRPGETVRWSVFVRRSAPEGIAPSDLGAVGYAIGCAQTRETLDCGSIDLAPPGNGAGSYDLPQSAAPGRYLLLLTDGADGGGNRIAERSFTVEEYRLPRFEARLTAPSEPAASGSTVEIEGRFTYLGGGPLAEAPVVWTLQRSSLWDRPEGFDGFSFRDERPRGKPVAERYGSTIRIASGEGRLDSDGRIRLPIVPSLEGLGQDQRYVLEMGAKDLADRSAYDAVAFPVHRASLRAGVRAARAEPPADSVVVFSAIALDLAGKPKSGVPLRWAVEKREWKTVRVRRIGGTFGYENVPRDTILLSGTASSMLEPYTFRWVPPGPGAYSFLVEAVDSRGRATSARADIHTSGSEAAPWYRDDGRWLTLKADRSDYAPEDTARVLVPAPAVPTEGLLLVLDEGIRSVRRLEQVEGSPLIPVPLSGFVPPGPHVRMILVGPTVVPEGNTIVPRLPYHGSGVVPLPIRLDPWRLGVEVTPEREVYEPGAEVALRIDLRDAAGRTVPGAVTVAVVDDAIFQLVENARVDPLTSIFPFRESGSDYADVRHSLRAPVTEEKGASTPGGDGFAEGPGFRRRFVPTVFWEAHRPVGPDGRVVVRFPLADDLTRFRVRVVASSAVDRFGTGEATFDVRKKLQIEWGSPRFAREGDRVAIAAVVRGEGERAIDVRLDAEAEGAQIEGEAVRRLQVKPKRGARTVFRLDEIGEDPIVLRLRASAGALSDAVEISIPVDHPLVWERAFQGGRVDRAVQAPVEAPSGVLPDRGGLTTVVTPTVLAGMEDALRYAIDYPYGCLEQLASVLLGIAAEKRIERHLGVAPTAPEDERERRARAAIETIRLCAESSWRIHAWPSDESSEASDYTVGYALLALARAREVGIEVPGKLIGRLAEEAMERLESMKRGSYDEIRRLLREGPWLLYCLSEAERLLDANKTLVPAQDVDALLSRREEAPLESRIVLGLALANLGARRGASSAWPAESKSLVREIRERNVQRTGRNAWVSGGGSLWGDGIGGDERTTALFLRLFAATDPTNDEIPRLVEWLLSSRRPKSGVWTNNHVTALTLDLLASTSTVIEPPLSTVEGTCTIGSEEEKFRLEPGGPPSCARTTPIRHLVGPGGEGVPTALRIETDGTRAVYFTSTLETARSALDHPALEEGLIVERRYVDTEGRPLGSTIPLGRPLFVHLAVVVSRDARNLVLEDPLPAGIEAVNLRFRNAPRVSLAEEPEKEDRSILPVVHREIRDRSVRLFAEDVRTGIYHVYYPAIAVAGGTFRVPGARAEFLYSPEIYAMSAGETLHVKEDRR
ncbi:MAG: hypothetical protein FJY73_09195 [Candidatus Eisenbacteria bacterium]|nr:hypothetical protein [Candidatus Eisenbacteria bacterium]